MNESISDKFYNRLIFIMKILHSGSLDANSGGPAMSTYNTLWGLQNLGVDTQVIMYPLSKNG